MAYRNGTYTAFDGNGEVNPTKSDFRYYGLLQAWNNLKSIEFNFSDSHKKTYKVKDYSLKLTLRNRLKERMRNSKNMLIILSDDTNWDRGELNYEIELAVDVYKIPLIITYPKFEYILEPKLLHNYWPKSLKERIQNKTANCIHIPFKEKPILSAISQFSVHDNNINHPLAHYTEETYKNWGIKK
ncbi:MAG: TIR domain-containing protein [Cetobacterium sp.]|uniref:TIR domain-containing protein n=1 Tax=Cetobacterium sp. TaxID=2071632 RepID=UPI003F30CD70